MNKKREEIIDQFDEVVQHCLDLDFSGIVSKKWSQRPEDQELCNIVDNFMKSLRHVHSYLNYNKEQIKRDHYVQFYKIFGNPFKEIDEAETKNGQKVQILESLGEDKLRALFMNECYTMDTDSEQVYHTALVGIGMQRRRAINPDTFKDLEATIIGGGDGGTLREVLSYPVTKASLLELDQEVVEICKRSLPTFSLGAFDDERFNPIYGDAFDNITHIEENSQDLVFVDLNDVEAPSEASTVTGSRAKHLIIEVERILKEDGVCAAYCGSYPRKYFSMFKKHFHQPLITVPDLHDPDSEGGRTQEWFFASGFKV